MVTTAYPMGRSGNDASIATETDFRSFVAFGLGTCWLSGDPEDINANCNFSRPVEPADVGELREHFLDALQGACHALWTGLYKPGEGYLDRPAGVCTIVKEDENGGAVDGAVETTFEWSVQFDNESMMVELTAIDGEVDPEALFLSYGTLLCRKKVVEVLEEAATHVPGYAVWDALKKMAEAETEPATAE